MKIEEKPRTVVVKLGGSLVTEKDKPLTPNLSAIRIAASNIRRALIRDKAAKTRLLLIHGGGSFGHYYASKYHLSSKRIVADNSIGVSKTAAAMQELHTIIVNELTKKDIPCKTLDATMMLLGRNRDNLSRIGQQAILDYIANGLVPVSFGNVLITPSGSIIVSGDTLCLAFSRCFPVERVIFAMDVDGIFGNSKLDGEILPSVESLGQIASAVRRFDVTGGVQSKLDLAFRIASFGTDVFFLNGARENRLARCISGDFDMKATRVQGRPSARLKNVRRQ